MAKLPLPGVHSFLRSLTQQASWPVGRVWHVLACVPLPLFRMSPRPSSQAAPEGQGLGCFAPCRPWCRAHTAHMWFMMMNEWVGSLHEEDAMITPIL